VNPSFQFLQAFSPPWYLRSGHIQTLITGFYKPKTEIEGEVRHLVPIGEFGHLTVLENKPLQPSQPSNYGVFLLHGLGSSSRGSYMSRIASILSNAGVRVFRFNLPGAGDSYHHTPLPPHGACSDLIWEALLRLSETCGVSRWRGAGVSLGGNILLKLLATHASELADIRAPFGIEKGVSVAPPIDLAACCLNMERHVNRVYAGYFLRSLRKQTISRAERWPQWKSKLPGASFRTIREFDESVTSGLAGYGSADEYYASGSSKEDLSRIQVPTTLLLDQDDPIVPFWIFDDAQFSPHMEVYVTRKGGHVGYLGRDSDRSRSLVRWADDWTAKQLLLRQDAMDDVPVNIG
jgi:uncharacterized protein